MFALSAPGRLGGLLEEAGFAEVVVDAVQLDRTYESVQGWIEETIDLSRMFADVYDVLDAAERAQVGAKIASLAEPYTSERGSLRLTGRSLVAAASA
jgi:hypothetical protein